MSEVSPERIELTRPDDWHLHLRDGAQMASVLPHTTARFARAIVMPNLRPPVVSTEMAREYRDRILEALPPGSDFEPLMTLYLTDNTPSAEIGRALESGFVHGLKLYPAGATTNSDDGVTDLGKLDHVFEAMAEAGLPLLVHGEVTEARVDIFDREKVFIEEVLAPLVERHPQLKLVFEHVTTAEAVDFVSDARDGVAATITAHHLLMDRNDMLASGMRPHHYCLPVLKRQRHRRRLLEAAASGSPRFFLGTDSAPHPRGAKLSGCGCAGIYTAHAALELYAEAFEEVDALDRLEGFASHHGADFYGLPRNRATLSLVREPWEVPPFYDFGEGRLVPLRAGERIRWRMEPADGDGSRHG